MKKKKKYNNCDIYKIKNHIKRIFPHVNKVDVKVNKLSNGEFKSLIRVIAPRGKELIAQKKDENVKRCLERSHLAIIKQIHKIKTKWERTESRSRVPDYAMSV